MENPTQLNKDISSKEQINYGFIKYPFLSIPFPKPLAPLSRAKRLRPPERKRTEAKSNSAVEIYREIIKDNIEYDHLIQNCKIDADRLNEIVDLMLETVLHSAKDNPYCRDDYPAELVKSKFLKLNSSHIEFVLDCMRENTTKSAQYQAVFESGTVQRAPVPLTAIIPPLSITTFTAANEHSRSLPGKELIPCRRK